MAPFQRPNRLFLLVIFCFSTVLAACSSGGGKGHSSPAPSDSRPDSFVITAPDGVSLENVPFNTPITSAPVTIEGIDTAAPVSITDGEFRINNGTFASTNATVRNGETITVRVQSPVKAGKSATATLNVGGVTASFTVTTGPDTTPPEVTILFPPPASMTEGETLFVRGTVKDVHGTLKAEGAVLVNGMPATLEPNSTGDEASWSVTLPLELGENEIVVTAEDAASNKNEDEGVASRRVESIAGESFPDDVNPFQGPLNATFGELNGQPVAFVTDDTAIAVFAVNLNSGARTLISDNVNQIESPFIYPWAVVYGSDGVLYISDNAAPAIFKVDLESGIRSVIATTGEGSYVNEPRGIFLRENAMSSQLFVADKETIFSLSVDTGGQRLVSGPALPDASNPINIAFGIVVSHQDELIAIDSGGERKVLKIDSETGIRSRMSSAQFSALNAIAVHPGGRSVLVVDDIKGDLSSVDIETGEQVVLSSLLAPDNVNAASDPWGVATSPSQDYALMIDPILKAVVAVDLDSGKRVILSKSN
jgi:hypothetical protein